MKTISIGRRFDYRLLETAKGLRLTTQCETDSDVLVKNLTPPNRRAHPGVGRNVTSRLGPLRAVCQRLRVGKYDDDAPRSPRLSPKADFLVKL